MRENKHIEKELLFNTNIKDITSISLDSDFKVEENSLKGNFIVSGEYKIHELSMNRESFNYKIPFNFELSNDIDADTLKLEIMDFTYDYKKDELLVKIDYEITAEKKDIIEFSDEESLDEFLLNREVEVIDTRLDDIKDCVDVLDKEEPKKEEEKQEVINEERDNLVDDVIQVTEDNKVVNPNDVLSKIDKNSDSYITYKVYKLNDNETLESIVIKYHTTIDELKDYNDINNLNIGDKIIIPYHE